MDADELVRRYIMRVFRSGMGTSKLGLGVLYPSRRNDHLAKCADSKVVTSEADYCRFWDTGVTGIQFTAVIDCPHGERQEFEFGELGELPDILADMERDEAGDYP